MYPSSLPINSSTLRPTNQTPPVLQVRSSAELYASLVSYSFLIATSLSGNGLVIGAYAYNHRLRKAVTHTLIIGLAFADFLVGLVSLPIWMYLTVSDSLDPQLNFVAYQFYITADIFIGSASILQLTCISIERSHAVLRPIPHRLLERKTFYYAVAAAWLCSAVLASLQPLQYGTEWQMVYTILMATACFFIPSVVVIIAYCSIFLATKVKKTLTKHQAHKSTPLRREVRLTLTVAMITLLFVVSWLPLFALTMIASFDPEVLPSPTTSSRLLHFVKWMHYSSSALNPFLYSYRNHDIRTTIGVILKRVFLRRGPSLDDVFRGRSSSVASSRFRKLSTVSERSRKTSTESQLSSPRWRSSSVFTWISTLRLIRPDSERTRKESSELEDNNNV